MLRVLFGDFIFAYIAGNRDEKNILTKEQAYEKAPSSTLLASI